MKTRTDKSCNDRKTMQDCIRHIEQKSNGRTTYAKEVVIYVHRSCMYTRRCETFVLMFMHFIANILIASHRIRLRLNSVHV